MSSSIRPVFFNPSSDNGEPRLSKLPSSSQSSRTRWSPGQPKALWLQHHSCLAGNQTLVLSTRQWHKRHKKQVVWEAKLPPVARESFTQILNPSTTKCEIVTMLAGANSYLSTTPKISQDPHQHNSHLFQPMAHDSYLTCS